MNILHLNDLHINNRDSEALRKAFYPEYFETLLSVINNTSKVELIFITGDIVDHAQKKNYPHAAEIIFYLADKLSVKAEKIYVINGNHDICRVSGNKDPFKEFSKNFETNKKIIGTGERYIFYQESKAGILCLDSIATNFKKGIPFPLSTQEKDEIVGIARQNDFDNIFVLSHHPPESYDVQNQAPFDEEKPDWSSKHVWSDGGNLHRRLASRANINGNVFWFAGDIHRPEHCIINKYRVLLITGSINAIEDSKSNIPPQVRIISTDDIEHSDLYEYCFVGHNRKGLEGHWEHKKVKAHNFDTDFHKEEIDQHEDDSLIIQAEEISNDESYVDEVHQLTLMNKDLENRIHIQVIERNLYEFGRFDTNPIVSSLSWVSIHNLLDSYSMFLSIINEFKRKINSIIPSTISKKDCLLVGIDSWGSILAARLGASTDIRSCCVAVRSKNDSYDSVERINDDLKKIVSGKKIAFVISDVIATGTSIFTIRNDLDCKGCSNWYNLVIFCDPTQNRTECFRGYKETFYICGSIKMPIIESSKLPETDILRPNISFIRN